MLEIGNFNRNQSDRTHMLGRFRFQHRFETMFFLTFSRHSSLPPNLPTLLLEWQLRKRLTDAAVFTSPSNTTPAPQRSSNAANSAPPLTCAGLFFEQTSSYNYERS